MNLEQKVEKGIFRVRIPIEWSPLKEVNAYLIVSSKKVLIVDPGPNHPLCLIVIETPGHSPGHCCLYEPNKRILFSEDHLLKEITPNVSLWSEEVDVLNLYLTNLKRFTELEVKIVLPGHGDPFSKFEKRICELERHHAERCDEILLI
jgi:glyoxylase-like metal-dependent hydrolase (beta-lactamase superfamily II)